ncbi:hypothetical protein ACFQV2_12905 [Actinokineospora soli]|uniref:Uncharacterized protein n=1 Tax=Actinokineospora soli TaxID=1048753 RepID=A0ABW2TKM2_9PSEU
MVFPGVSVLAIGGFVLSALNASLATGKPWYSVTAVIAVLLVDLVLTVLIVQSLWTAGKMG